MLAATHRLESQAVEWGGRAGALGHMSVDFGGFDAAVAQQVLNDAGIGCRLAPLECSIRWAIILYCGSAL